MLAGQYSVTPRHMPQLTIGLPKGSLEAATLELFRKSGWKISGADRSYFPSVDDDTLRLTWSSWLVDETITVNIPPGPGTYVVSHRLRFRAANLIVASNTPAYVVIDEGNARGRTWSVITVQQPNDMIGMHVVRVSADGHRDVVREVRLRAGQLERVEVTLEKVPEVAPPPG